MAIAKNDDDVQEVMVDDTSKKMKAEIPFDKDLNQFFRKVNSEFEQQYLVDETIIDAKEFKPELMALLAINYNKIGNKFKNNIRESFEEKTNEIINATINTEINKTTKDLSLKKSDIILDTTNKDIADTVSQEVAELIEEAKEITAILIANEVRKKLNKSAKGRSATVAITETENFSELTKNIEEGVLINSGVVLDDVNLSESLKDVWVTVLDERTREDHAMADGQQKNFNESFLVGGELLRYPGDPNGSPSNIINCRCSSVRKFVISE